MGSGPRLGIRGPFGGQLRVDDTGRSCLRGRESCAAVGEPGRMIPRRPCAPPLRGHRSKRVRSMFKIAPGDFVEPAMVAGRESCAAVGGPGRIRTCNQGIHFALCFQRGLDYLFTRVRDEHEGAGRSSLLLRTLKSSGSLCTFWRCIASLAQGRHRSDRKVSLNSSRSFHGFRRERTI